MGAPELEIVIPVYNEGTGIVRVLTSLAESVRTPFRVLIAYDHDEDDTLAALKAYPGPAPELRLVKNRGEGAFGAVMTGFQESRAPAVIMLPADDDYNAPLIDRMVELFRDGCEIVVASRFMRGGCMRDCPALKATLVRLSAAALHAVARVPTRDPTNGFRLFSRKVLDRVPIESTMGFAYSIELLVKCHRLGWRIAELPAAWYQRREGTSRFRVVKWVPQYLKWFFYAFATTFLRRGAETVPLKAAR